MKEMHLKSTKSYSIFNSIIGNRNLDSKNLKRIKESINEIGLQMPILVNENNSIIDGQHRLQAAKELEIPITYIVSKDSCEQNIDQLQISKKWTALDFCNRNALKGNKDCQKALKMAEEWFTETNGKLSKINTLSLLNDSHMHSCIGNLRKNTYKINVLKGYRVYEAATILNYNKNESFNAYTYKILLTLKRLDSKFSGLDFKIITKLATKHYLQSYTNNVEQYNYLLDLYNKYKK
tara:strand:+ start:1179 stop:1886 length:708 start_codon:yes stop_codon:yes gene_type:complete